MLIVTIGVQHQVRLCGVDCYCWSSTSGVTMVRTVTAGIQHQVQLDSGYCYCWRSTSSAAGQWRPLLLEFGIKSNKLVEVSTSEIWHQV